MSYVIDPPAQPALPIAGSDDLFPVRRIFCVGRNYVEHIRELGNDEREPPFFFMKSAASIALDGETIPYPPDTSNLHHEAELVVAIGTGGTDIAPEDALDHVWGYGAGIDLTRRDLQDQAKQMRRPWDFSKGFDKAAIFGALHPVSETGHLPKGSIKLTVDGETRQDADLSEMIWPVPDIIAFASRSMTLEPGDLFMTGTPAGVSPLVPGNTAVVEIEGLSPLTVTIAG